MQLVKEVVGAKSSATKDSAGRRRPLSLSQVSMDYQIVPWDDHYTIWRCCNSLKVIGAGGLAAKKRGTDRKQEFEETWGPELQAWCGSRLAFAFIWNSFQEEPRCGYGDHAVAEVDSECESELEEQQQVRQKMRRGRNASWDAWVKRTKVPICSLGGVLHCVLSFVEVSWGWAEGVRQVMSRASACGEFVKLGEGDGRKLSN